MAFGQYQLIAIGSLHKKAAWESVRFQLISNFIPINSAALPSAWAVLVVSHCGAKCQRCGRCSRGFLVFCRVYMKAVRYGTKRNSTASVTAAFMNVKGKVHPRTGHEGPEWE